jgi:hypothetical protein
MNESAIQIIVEREEAVEQAETERTELKYTFVGSDATDCEVKGGSLFRIGQR